ncbi:hypothetical protein AAFF_G00328390 [Aldrovandia affinis]|uniref:Uncharacterized protein n=1 Tax=Aldrovandia affinis TaxID=143900 RepID=A0AAD7TB99_9TELE|nr:hypothetical protein AAFF_G00328390 [Aldrovandia affinis]
MERLPPHKSPTPGGVWTMPIVSSILSTAQLSRKTGGEASSRSIPPLRFSCSPDRGLFLTGLVTQSAAPCPVDSKEPTHSTGVARSNVERRATTSIDGDRGTSPDSPT